MSRRLCIETKPGYVVSAMAASYKYLAVVYEPVEYFTRPTWRSTTSVLVYYIDIYEIDNSYGLHKILDMEKLMPSTPHSMEHRIKLLFDENKLYLIECAEYPYGCDDEYFVSKMNIDADFVVSKIKNTGSGDKYDQVLSYAGQDADSYYVMDHECKYYEVKYVYGKYRTFDSPYEMSTIQLTSKQSAFMAGKFTKSGMREFAIYDATHVTQVIMRGEFTGLSRTSTKLEVYPAFIADSAGRIQLTYLRPDTKAEFTAWNIYYHILGGELNGFPSELLDVIAEYC